MMSRTKQLALLVAAALLFAGAVSAQQATPGTGKGPKAEQAKSLLDQGKDAEALALAEAGLKAAPWNPELGYCKIEALLGLGRYLDAARTSLQMAAKNPGRPEFRFLAGESAYQMGMVPQAVRSWSALLEDKEWCEPACRRAVLALMATGKEAQAVDLIKKTVAGLDKPPVGLLRLELNLTTDVPDGLALAGRLIKEDPANKGEYEALRDLFKAAGSGSLFDEAPIKSLPVTIPIKEKSGFRDLSTLTWGSMDIGTSRVTTTTQVVVVPSTAAATSRSCWKAAPRPCSSATSGSRN